MDEINKEKKGSAAVPLFALIKKDRKILFDSSALSHVGFTKFLDSNMKQIKRSSNCFFIPKFEYLGLSDPLKNSIQPLVDSGVFSILDFQDVHDYMELLPAIKGMGKEKGQLCFVCNNGKKAISILVSAKKESVFVQFFHIAASGDLLSGMAKSDSNSSNVKSNQDINRKRTNNDSDIFHISDKPVRMRIQPIPIKKVCGKGDIIYNSKHEPIELLKEQRRDYNGSTYSTNIPNVWAKIYKLEYLNTFIEAKVKKMLSHNIHYKGLCWPTDVVTNSDGQFIGILLPPAEGDPLQLSVFKQAKFQKLFPNWNKKDLCDLTITILQVVQYLHSKNILLGCINPAAIRVNKSGDVYFIETDNYQIEGFPSLQHNLTFTPPEFLGKKIYLSKKENENYSVAVLVFMLMMPGKYPYTRNPNQSTEESLKDRKFPFPYGSVHGDHAMPSVWRFMWSHLTPFKDVFYNTFQKGGKLEKPADRKTVGSWIGTVKYFREELESPVDPESLKLYPQSFKKGKNDIFYKCSYCGISHPRFFFSNRYFDNYQICNSCIGKRSNVSFTCKACGKTYYYTNETDLFHRTMKSVNTEWKDQKYCKDCKNKTLRCSDCGEEKPYYVLKNGRCTSCEEKRRNAVYTYIQCKDCGRTFSVTVGEREFALQKNLTFPPSRCKDCRDKRRNNKW